MLGFRFEISTSTAHTEFSTNGGALTTFRWGAGDAEDPFFCNENKRPTKKTGFSSLFYRLHIFVSSDLVV